MCLFNIWYRLKKKKTINKSRMNQRERKRIFKLGDNKFLRTECFFVKKKENVLHLKGKVE